MRAIDLFAGPPGRWDVGAISLGINMVGVTADPKVQSARSAAHLRTLSREPSWYNPTVTNLHYHAGLVASPPCPVKFERGEVGWLCTAIRQELGRVPASVFPRTGAVLEPLRWILSMWEAVEGYMWICLDLPPAGLPIWEAYGEILRETGYSVAVGSLDADRYGAARRGRRAILLARLGATAELPEPTYPRRDRSTRAGRQEPRGWASRGLHPLLAEAVLRAAIL